MTNELEPNAKKPWKKTLISICAQGLEIFNVLDKLNIHKITTLRNQDPYN